MMNKKKLPIFPKDTNFLTVFLEQIKENQRSLNDHLEAVLNYQKPDEVLNNFVVLKVQSHNHKKGDQLCIPNKPF